LFVKLKHDDFSAGHGGHAFPVLVIDDDEADRELTIRHLSRAWPFEHEMIAEHAASGDEALNKMSVTHYALAVLDWRLPDMDGGDMLRAMRRKRILTPVIIISGMRREHITENIEAFGAAFLNKDDIDPLTLRDAIATALRRLGIDGALAA
jgi:two-component system sensor histidine kinase/response regulator